jgi:hypothetical protein
LITEERAQLIDRIRSLPTTHPLAAPIVKIEDYERLWGYYLVTADEVNTATLRLLQHGQKEPKLRPIQPYDSTPFSPCV